MMKGVIPNVKAKMDISSVEAMLSESNLNTKNSQTFTNWIKASRSKDGNVILGMRNTGDLEKM